MLALRASRSRSLGLLGPMSAGDALMTRVKDIASISGVAEHKLMGYGLVVGLDGSGDSSRALFTARSLANMLERFGVQVEPDRLSGEERRRGDGGGRSAGERGERRGASTCCSPHSATRDSLHGGTLLATPLHGGDGEVYAHRAGAGQHWRLQCQRRA
jgi:flagellar P-ring protein precursor FlgI